MLSSMINKLRTLRERMLQAKWSSYIEGLRSRGLELGANVQFAEDVFLDPAHCFLISIGNNVTFAPKVRLIAHDASLKHHLGFTRIGKIKIHDDCFIGDSVIILPGVSIGPRSIIGAGSVVTKDIPPACVAAGTPAKVICTVDDYLNKYKEESREKGTFGPEYLLPTLTPERKKEMLRRLDNGCGFMV